MVSDLNLKESHTPTAGEKGKKRMHPHKFTMWVAMGSIIMMFAGLTSAFIVKSNQVNWKTIALPRVFWYSTAVIILSSVTLQAALRSFKQREMSTYRTLMGVTLLLGVTFIALQWAGFNALWANNVTFKGAGAGQFLYVIFGLHGLHVIGGIVALIIMFIKAFVGRTKMFSSVPVEIMATYWHFVDALWIYLIVFFLILGSS
jgi:cytochrome c oxidase subunit III